MYREMRKMTRQMPAFTRFGIPNPNLTEREAVKAVSFCGLPYMSCFAQLGVMAHCSRLLRISVLILV